MCQHSDRPNCISLPSMGNPHMCRECWDNNVQPLLDAMPAEPLRGKIYEYRGPWIRQENGTLYREQVWTA